MPKQLPEPHIFMKHYLSVMLKHMPVIYATGLVFFQSALVQHLKRFVQVVPVRFKQLSVLPPASTFIVNFTYLTNIKDVSEDSLLDYLSLAYLERRGMREKKLLNTPNNFVIGDSPNIYCTFFQKYLCLGLNSKDNFEYHFSPSKIFKDLGFSLSGEGTSILFRSDSSFKITVFDLRRWCNEIVIDLFDDTYKDGWKNSDLTAYSGACGKELEVKGDPLLRRLEGVYDSIVDRVEIV